MPVSKAPDNSLDDVQVLGTWNFTLQGDTPMYWLRTGQLDRYLLHFRVSHRCPCVCGLVIHCEVDGPGTDGASFWVERRIGKDGEPAKRYVLAGEGLDSKPIVTRNYPDDGADGSEEIEILMEGYDGTIMLQNRKVQLRFRTKHNKGSIGFYNSTQGDRDEIHFGGIRVTALRRGPLEIDGRLLRKEREYERLDAEGLIISPEEASPTRKKPLNFASTSKSMTNNNTIPSLGPRSRSASSFTMTKSLAGGNISDFGLTLPSPGKGTVRLQSPAGGSLSPMKLGGRGKAGTASSSRLQLSFAAESTLKKSGSTISGAGGLSPGFGATSGSNWDTPSGTGRKWVPLALNAPAGEQQLLKSISRKAGNPNKDCTDFIPL
mmetsp:Transcript_57122/g.121420  ORF Transcript_57122/g.121420 Transcript_57122/m.121420 type:complete len:376 (-) Transcript_57122:271-1398(-)|eukprot:CAMPEP_0206467758 /NCGR_PEP_ID=MMETSP0324_2-20121206/29220_1 /ASSEMBLY_ACC=CAM_ASM_000836 /TAXON_ID=2866 /ORGANISM="Crypthecodinium cohnii, Strain Seligo" /LENGTH=375 /DNA_ID=CAMNT_0053941077 /DNA_START=126 /DNA_END=1253 /DNA_ORIENTATION=+